MKKITKTLIVLFLLAATSAVAQRQIGSNLSPINDYSSQFVFKDVFKASREWIPFNSDGSGGWTSGVSVPLRADGYPLEIPYDNGINPSQSVRSLMLWDLPHGYPSGAFTLNLEGTGSVKLVFGANGTFTSPGTYTFTPNGGAFGIEILSSDVSDPIHKIEAVLPGYQNNYTSAPFYPDFLDFTQDFGLLRFMDLMETNNSPIVNWSDRTPANYYSQATNTGVAYEYLVQLANTSNKDIWICIPHQASDSYITQLATFLLANLNSSSKIYLEYSNEVWNGIFTQYNYAAQQGAILGYSGQPWEQSWKYYAKRTADVFYLFEQVYGVNNSKIEKVIAAQSANSWLSNYIVERFNEVLYNPNGVTADALAIAPYFGGTIADEIGDEGLINTITIDQILDRAEATLPGMEQDIIAQKMVADIHTLKLITYEGGQHIVSNNYRENTTLTQKLTDANRTARMETVYCDYFDIWYNNLPSGMFVHFSSIGEYSKYGSWGAKEYIDQPLSSAPKFRAIENCVFNAVVLPVDLLRFQLDLSQKRYVAIKWEVEKEEQLDYYQIERSGNGETFVPLGSISAGGMFFYTYLDKAPLENINYYRLKMIDLDGDFTYSSMRSIGINMQPDKLITVNPNPFNSNLNITFKNKNQDGLIELFSINGKLVFQDANHSEELILTNLPEGIYFLRYTSEYKVETIKLIKTN